MRILLVEDNEQLTRHMRDRFAAEHISLDAVTTAADALPIALSAAYDACIVDRALSDRVDGLRLVEQLRALGSTMPILVLSALADVAERIEGLRVGADDYLAKPFDFGELHARIMALGRRRAGSRATDVELRVGDLRMDTRSRTVKRGERIINLKPMEFRVLQFLLHHCGQVVTRKMLLEQVWEHGFDPGTNIIDVQISKLRAKIDTPADEPLLHTIRSIGYMLTSDR